MSVKNERKKNKINKVHEYANTDLSLYQKKVSIDM
jgi:hypothetical protein